MVVGEETTRSCPPFGAMGGASELERSLLCGSADRFAGRGWRLLGETGLRSVLDAFSGRGVLELRGCWYCEGSGGGGGALEGPDRPSCCLTSFAGTGSG